VLVVVFLSLSNLLLKSFIVGKKALENREIDGLKEHTGELTPKGLITRIHGHDASVDSLTNSLLLVNNRSSGLNRLDGGLGLLLRDLSRLLLLLLHLALLLVHAATLVGAAVVGGTRVGSLTREHLTLHVRIHVGEAVHHVGSEELLADHATHDRVHALLAALGLEHSTTVGLLLSESDIKRLAVEQLAHDLLDSLRGGFRGGKVAETEALAGTVGVLHDDAALDLTKVLEEVAEVLIGDIISKVTDVKVGLGHGSAGKISLAPTSAFTLVLLHGTADVQLEDSDTVLLELVLVFTFLKRANESFILPLEGLAVEGLLGLDSVFVLLKVDETEATALVGGSVHHDDGRSDLTVLLKHLDEVVGGELLADVLHVDVGEGFVGIVGTLTSADELLNNEVFTKDLELILVVLAGLKSLLVVLDLLELDETIATAGTVILSHDLAGGDGAKVGEDILKLDESDALVKTLDKEVTLTALTLRGITTRPHDTARLALEGFAIESIKSLLSVLVRLEVDISITKRVVVLHITANTNGTDGTTFLESVVDFCLSDIITKITDVKRAVGESSRSGSRDLLSRHSCFTQIFFLL